MFNYLPAVVGDGAPVAKHISTTAVNKEKKSY